MFLDISPFAIKGLICNSSTGAIYGIHKIIICYSNSEREAVLGSEEKGRFGSFRSPAIRCHHLGVRLWVSKLSMDLGCFPIIGKRAGWARSCLMSKAAMQHSVTNFKKRE